MKKLIYLFILLGFVLSLSCSCCSVYSTSSFSTDSAKVHNLHIVKTDSINIKPFK